MISAAKACCMSACTFTVLRSLALTTIPTVTWAWERDTGGAFLAPRRRARILGAVVRKPAPDEELSPLGVAILDAVPISLYVVDRGLKVRAWNRQREQGARGQPRRDVLGRDLR